MGELEEEGEQLDHGEGGQTPEFRGSLISTGSRFFGSQSDQGIVLSVLHHLSHPLFSGAVKIGTFLNREDFGCTDFIALPLF